MKNFMEQLIRFHNVFEIFFATCRFFPMRPKGSLETTISERDYLPSEKLIWTLFSCIIGCVKPQRTIYEGRKGILAFTVQVIGSFFLGPKTLLTTWIFEKKATLALKNLYSSYSSQFKEYEKFHETTYRGPQCFWHFFAI